MFHRLIYIYGLKLQKKAVNSKFGATASLDLFNAPGYESGCMWCFYCFIILIFGI